MGFMGAGMFTLTDTQQSTLKLLPSRFAEVPDTRQQGKVRHRLDEVLMVALCAVLCDCDSFTDMEDFAQTQLLWLRSFLAPANGAPSHDVFRNVLLALRAQALLDILTGWCGETHRQAHRHRRQSPAWHPQRRSWQVSRASGACLGG